MLDDHGYGLSRRRVTVSTSGVVPMIDRLREDVPVALAVSLHAPNDPLAQTSSCLSTASTPLAELLAVVPRLPRQAAPRDFITFEYCMLDGVNDSAANMPANCWRWSPARRRRIRCLQAQPHSRSTHSRSRA